MLTLLQQDCPITEPFDDVRPLVSSKDYHNCNYSLPYGNIANPLFYKGLDAMELPNTPSCGFANRFFLIDIRLGPGSPPSCGSEGATAFSFQSNQTHPYENINYDSPMREEDR